MPAAMPAFLANLKAKGAISAADVISIRKTVYPDGIIQDAEAQWLFDLNNSCKKGCREWQDLFVEALTDYAVFQMKPEGYVSEENAKWLRDQISSDGKVDSVTEMELLINILDKATSAPASLSSFALQQVKDAVISGEGLFRNGMALEAGRVSVADVQILRRVLYAYGSGGNMTISREEAEVLFDINDATKSSENDPEWLDLFSKAIANHLMHYTVHQPLSREVALRREEWLNDNSSGLSGLTDSTAGMSGFFTRMLSGLADVYRGKNHPEPRSIRLEENIKLNGQVTEVEASWIVERIGRDGYMSEAESAVLGFIKREAPEVHPALRVLLDKVA